MSTHGYTGHEHVKDVGLINTNARMYDPLTGRFLSPDPMVQASIDLQEFNPYSYVGNNPLSFTDPTGMCKGFFGCLGEVFQDVFTLHLAVPLIEHNPWLGDIAVAASAIECSEAGPEASAACAFGTEAQIAGYETGSIVAGLEAGAITGAEVYAFQEIGGYTDAAVKAGPIAGASFYEAYAEQIAGDGFVGGLTNVAEGQSFESGFLAAGFSAAAGPLMFKGSSAGAFAANLAEQSVEGGIGSVIGGGKFENGAITGAFGYLFNRFNRCGGPHGCFDAGVMTGTAAGIASSIGCDAGTLGACVVLDPIIVGSTAVVGGIVGGIEDLWGNIVYASDPAPTGLPSGTRPINNWGISQGDIHAIKGGAYGDSNATGWTGITPGGQVIITGPDGAAEDAGHVDDYTNQPLPKFPRPSD